MFDFYFHNIIYCSISKDFLFLLLNGKMYYYFLLISYFVCGIVWVIICKCCIFGLLIFNELYILYSPYAVLTKYYLSTYLKIYNFKHLIYLIIRFVILLAPFLIFLINAINCPFSLKTFLLKLIFFKYQAWIMTKLYLVLKCIYIICTNN